MIRILFVCHGNICRSPMAEYVFKDLLKRKGLSSRYYVESAAARTDEIGNPVYPPAARVLNRAGIDCSKKRARLITKEEYDVWDLIIIMDAENRYDLNRLYDGDPEEKVHMLMEYTEELRNVADPWYTGDFEATWRDVNEGCLGLLEMLEGEDGN